MAEQFNGIAAVVLTGLPRMEYLERLIAALRSQTRRLDEIIVVYQPLERCDDIDNWLASQSDLTVVKQRNAGSAGGFCAGIEESIRRGHNWTWIFDDDAIPELTALEELVSTPYFGRPDTVFLASRVVDRDGRTYMSPRAADANRWYATVLEDKCVEVVGACWLGMLVCSTAVRKYGLPISEFYFQQEDVEFSERLACNGKAYCAIRSLVVHFQNPKFDPFGKDFEKFAYLVRNRIARAKLLPGPLPVKMLRAFRSAGHYVGLVLKGEAPVRIVPWVMRGVFFFWPRIRYPS